VTKGFHVVEKDGSVAPIGDDDANKVAFASILGEMTRLTNNALERARQ
jgi:hypothetical protein